MNITDFRDLSSAFGLINSSCIVTAACFLAWQNEILQQYGFELTSAPIEGKLNGALKLLHPRSAPIITKYMFWPVDAHWTLYFDNGMSGSDAGPPCVLSSKLDVNAIRIVMADEITEATTTQVIQYRATIFEYYAKGVEQRHIFVANDGGKWKFGEWGEPFPFENTDAYKLKSKKDRFTNTMLLEYLRELGVNIRSSDCSPVEYESGLLLTKSRKVR